MQKLLDPSRRVRGLVPAPVRTLLVAVAIACGLAAPVAAAERPAWAVSRHMTVFRDSVLLSGAGTFKEAMPDWRVAGRGRPALMVGAAEREFRASGARVSPLVVIGLGYNSLWERDRRNYKTWSRRFDREAERFMRTLRVRGARQFVWVNMRRPTRANTPGSGYFQLHDYAWYFGYVNERLAKLDAKHDDLVVADWGAIGKRNGVTYDAIHLNTKGSKLMASLLERTIRSLARGEVPTP